MQVYKDGLIAYGDLFQAAFIDSSLGKSAGKERL